MNDLLLVDDELAVLDGLKIALDWSEYGFKHVHTAQCAEDAMAIMKEHPIDLLILDILMPGMNGLEMLKAVRSRHPNIHCIFVSAHSKFEYAREALRLNVENYLLKPIDVNELQETVYRAVENISREAADLHNLFERNMLERWLYGRITSDELMEHSRFTEYNVLMRRYYAIAVYLEGNVQVAMRLLKAQFLPNYPAYDLLVDESNGILLTGGRDITGEMIRETIAGTVAAYPMMRVICGSCATSSSEVSKSLADANHALEYARLANMPGFVSYDGIDWMQLSAEQHAELSDLIRRSDAGPAIRKWAEGWATSSDGMALRTMYAHICLTLMHILDEDILTDHTLAPIHAPYNLPAFLNAVEAAVTALCESKQKRMHALSPIIQLAVKYISDNINSALSIKQFCEQRKTNAAYIGRLFKEETGMYFSDYVNMLRINKAKFLLESSSLSVSEIACNVGIYDVSYFTQRFKKQVRMSPMKYRQSCQHCAGEQ